MSQIIAMGGGGFLMEPDNPALDRYILDQSGADRPKVCMLATPSGDSENMLLRFYRTFSRLDCQPSELSLFQPHTADIQDFLLNQDVIYVGGGNTRSMLALWREWGLDVFLKTAYDAGIVLAGVSAGANCWFEECSTDSIAGQLSVWPCLGYLPGSFCPHYDGEAERRPWMHRMIADGSIKPGLAADDGAAAHFVDGVLTNAVASRPQAHLYRLDRDGDQAVETPVPIEFLINA
jgi:peptidase E